MPKKATLPNALQKYWNEPPNENKNKRVTFNGNSFAVVSPKLPNGKKKKSVTFKRNSFAVVSPLYKGLPKQNHFQTPAEHHSAILEAKKTANQYTHMNRRIAPNEAARLGQQLAEEEVSNENMFSMKPFKPLGTTNNWFGGTRKKRTTRKRMLKRKH